MSRFSPDQLRSKALLALEEAVQETRYRPVRHTLALRFSLAYLWAQSAGDRAPYDRLWKELSSKDAFWRFRNADSALGSIYLSLDLQRDHDLGFQMWQRLAQKFRPVDGNGIPILVEPPSD